MLKTAKMVLLLLFLTLLLTACSSTKTLTIKEVLEVKQEIPSELLVSQELPTIPVDAKKQSEVATYITELLEVAIECKSNQDEIRRIIK